MCGNPFISITSSVICRLTYPVCMAANLQCVSESREEETINVPLPVTPFQAKDPLQERAQRSRAVHDDQVEISCCLRWGNNSLLGQASTQPASQPSCGRRRRERDNQSKNWKWINCRPLVKDLRSKDRPVNCRTATVMDLSSVEDQSLKPVWFGGLDGGVTAKKSAHLEFSARPGNYLLNSGQCAIRRSVCVPVFGFSVHFSVRRRKMKTMQWPRTWERECIE